MPIPTASRSITVSQPIYTGGRVHSQVNEAQAGILAGRQTLRRGELDLIERVVAAYVSVLRDQALVSVSEDTVTVLEKQLSDTEARAAPNVRELTETDVAESSARLSQARSDLANARASLAVSRAQYVATVGQPPGDLAPLPEIENLPATVDAAFSSAENNNPQLLSAFYTEERSRARIDEAKAATHPTVSAQLNVYRAPYLPYAGAPYNNTVAATVTITQPIYTAGLLQSQVRQSVDQNEADRLNIDDIRQQVVLAVSAAWGAASVAARLQITNSHPGRQRRRIFVLRQQRRIEARAALDDRRPQRSARADHGAAGTDPRPGGRIHRPRRAATADRRVVGGDAQSPRHALRHRRQSASRRARRGVAAAGVAREGFGRDRSTEREPPPALEHRRGGSRRLAAAGDAGPRRADPLDPVHAGDAAAAAHDDATTCRWALGLYAPSTIIILFAVDKLAAYPAGGFGGSVLAPWRPRVSPSSTVCRPGGRRARSPSSTGSRARSSRPASSWRRTAG